MSSSAADETPHKQKKTEETSRSSLSSLSDTVALSCLARVSRLDHSSLSLVSKRYHSLMTSPEFYNTRSQLGCTEKCLYVCLRTPPDLTPRWFILRRAKTPNQLIPIRTFPSQTPESASVVAVDWGIYIFGGIIDDEYTSDVLFLDCRTHTWLRAPSMGARRAFAAAGVLNGKIYVFGGCENPNSGNWGEVFDPKLQTWDTLPLPDWKICSNSIHQSLVIDEKVYAIDKFNRNFYYSLSEDKWDCNSFNLGLICIPNDSEVESRNCCIVVIIFGICIGVSQMN